MNGTTIQDLQKQEHVDGQGQVDMEKLARDINNNIIDVNTDSDTTTQEQEGSFDMPYMFKEAIVLLLLYVVLSYGPVKGTIGKYLTIINPNEEGVVSMTGVVIYGLILVILFITIKKYLL